MAGSVYVGTPIGGKRLIPGDVMILGREMPCSAKPSPEVRSWTIYLLEDFLRRYMQWALPSPSFVRSGLHPDEWDGRPIFLRLGTEGHPSLESLLRKMSVLRPNVDAAASARMMALFAQSVALSVHHLVEQPTVPSAVPTTHSVRRLSASPISPEVSTVATMLRSELNRTWTVTELARAVSLSTSQLTRRFSREFGVPPMRWLAEARTTEFARLMEETALPVDVAALHVGWANRRVAVAWFGRRYGVSPTQYRR